MFMYLLHPDLEIICSPDRTHWCFSIISSLCVDINWTCLFCTYANVSQPSLSVSLWLQRQFKVMKKALKAKFFLWFVHRSPAQSCVLELQLLLQSRVKVDLPVQGFLVLMV